MKARTVVSFVVALLVVMTVAVGATAQSPVSEFDTVLADRFIATDSITTPSLTTTGAVIAGTVASTGAITGSSFAGQVAATRLNTTEGAEFTVTAGENITPTHTLHFITAAGVITAGSVAPGTQGMRLTLINSGTNAITINDGAPMILSGNIALGQWDSLSLVYRGTSWIQVATSNN